VTASLVLSAVLFAVIYFPVFDRLSRGLASAYGKADLVKRFSAVMVDSMVVATAVQWYRSSGSMWFIVAALLYMLLRDSVGGRSIGKFCFGLVVIDLHTNQPCGFNGSIKRNVVWILPGANVAAAFLETLAIVRDPQGQRLGDRLAQTQVVEGLGVKDLAAACIRWWRGLIGEMDGSPERRRRIQGTSRACAGAYTLTALPDARSRFCRVARCAISNSIEVARTVLR